MRYPSSSPRTVIYRFGPGPVTLVVKALIWANVVMFVLSWLVPDILPWLGLRPAAVFSRLFVWQPVTYMFLHAGVFHILFNMLALWMFGVELERLWGPRFFLKYYLITGVGAAATTLALALFPGQVGTAMR
jgi:membrane associated rhomboid family serine protease